MSTEDPKYQVTRAKAPTYEVKDGISLAGIKPEVEIEWADEDRAAAEIVRRIIQEGGEEWWCHFMRLVGEDAWEKVIGWSQPIAVAEPPDYGDPEWDPDYWPQWEVHIRGIPQEERLRVMTYLRRRYSMSLADAKHAVDHLPFVLRRGLSKHEAEDLMPDLLALGCIAEVVVGERVE